MARYQCILPTGNSQTRSYSPLYSSYHGWLLHSKAFFRRSMGLSHCHATTTAQPPVSSSPSNLREVLPGLQAYNTSVSLCPDSYPVCKHVRVDFFIQFFNKTRVEGHCHVSMFCLSLKFHCRFDLHESKQGQIIVCTYGQRKKWFLETIHCMQIVM